MVSVTASRAKKVSVFQEPSCNWEGSEKLDEYLLSSSCSKAAETQLFIMSQAPGVCQLSLSVLNSLTV